MQKKMKQEVQDLLRRGIIRPSTSPYSASISMVEKKDRTIRICSAPIGLNAATIDDGQPLPNMRELMDAIAGAKYYSSWDLISGFWQIEIEEGDKAKTAFSTSWGHYEYNVMPFGLKGAPVTFQRLMTKVLGLYLYDFVMVYLDDIIIFSQTMDKHLQHMRKVLEALRQAGLKLKLEKCEFAKKQLKYLGFIIGEFEIKPNLEKVRAIADQLIPTNQTQIRSFLGMIRFFRNHIQGFLTITGPMTNLLTKEVPYV